MLIKELFYSWWLLATYKLKNGEGMRYPLNYRGRARYIFHSKRERAESALFLQLKYSPLVAFLKSRKNKNGFVLIATVDEKWLWVNVYLLDKTEHPGPSHTPVYNEKRGDDGTFNFVILNHKLLKCTPVKGMYYIPSATLLTWRGKVNGNEREFIESLSDNA